MGHPVDVFVFFSNRLGCFGSIALSIFLTLILVVILRLISH
jgi:hypothetical protein